MQIFGIIGTPFNSNRLFNTTTDEAMENLFKK